MITSFRISQFRISNLRFHISDEFSPEAAGAVVAGAVGAAGATGVSGAAGVDDAGAGLGPLLPPPWFEEAGFAPPLCLFGPKIVNI